MEKAAAASAAALCFVPIWASATAWHRRSRTRPRASRNHTRSLPLRSLPHSPPPRTARSSGACPGYRTWDRRSARPRRPSPAAGRNTSRTWNICIRIAASSLPRFPVAPAGLLYRCLASPSRAPAGNRSHPGGIELATRVTSTASKELQGPQAASAASSSPSGTGQISCGSSMWSMKRVPSQ